MSEVHIGMRACGALRILVGLLLGIVGCAMFLSPELTWPGLKATAYQLYENIGFKAPLLTRMSGGLP